MRVEGTGALCCCSTFEVGVSSGAIGYIEPEELNEGFLFAGILDQIFRKYLKR